MAFNNNLKSLRLSKGLTQQQVADALGITKATYSGYETGRREPDVYKIKLIAKLFNVSGDELLETGFNPEIVTAEEIGRIKKYRALDERGKKMVDLVLNEELVQSGAMQHENVVPFVAMGGGGVISEEQAERDLYVADDEEEDDWRD